MLAAGGDAQHTLNGCSNAESRCLNARGRCSDAQVKCSDCIFWMLGKVKNYFLFYFAHLVLAASFAFLRFRCLSHS